MNLYRVHFIFVLAAMACMNCKGQPPASMSTNPQRHDIRVLTEHDVLTGAERSDQYLPILSGKNVGAVVNQSSRIGDRHLIDSLQNLGVDMVRLFSPEHGIRGRASAGEHVGNDVDADSGLPIISLYGDDRKPTPEHLEDIEVMIFDLQDVGVRFYTYLSTLYYVMQTCADSEIPLIVLDRPNPHGFYVDGPILESDYKSFVGALEIPIVHGMTLGEIAGMIVGEGWLDGQALDLTVISCKGYHHQATYKIPIAPSPNLPNHRSVMLYPSLCLFEATDYSIGRGTDFPFQVLGRPDARNGDFYFKPRSKEGAMRPKHEGVMCRGIDLRDYDLDQYYEKKQLDLSFVIEKLSGEGMTWLSEPDFFDRLAGTSRMRKYFLEGWLEYQIREDWKNELSHFRKKRAQYLLYEDF